MTTATSNYVFHDLKPMKMKDITQTHRTKDDLLQDDNWLLQQKMDGTRAFIKIKYDEIDENWDITWLSSNGSPLKHAAAKLHFHDIEASLVENEHLSAKIDLDDDGGPGEFIVTEAILDAELIIETGQLFVFDMPWLRASLDNQEKLLCEPFTPMMSRLARIQDLLHIYPDFGTVRSLSYWGGRDAKTEALGRLKGRGVEGGVFKHKLGTYGLNPKKRVTDQLKLKFVKDADVVVLDRNRGGKENATLGVLAPSDATPLGVAMQKIGTCTMIGKPDAQPGDVITVQYLYWTGGSMIQPRMVEIRHDKEPGECTIDQFPTYSREAV